MTPILTLFVYKMRTVVNTRIDTQLKTTLQNMAEQMGISLSSLISAALTKVARERKLEMVAPREYHLTPEYEKELITWEDFKIIELRTGTVIKVDDFPEAQKPAYKITVDFGEKIGIRKTSAQVTDLYTKKDILGKQIIGIVNFPKKQIGPFMSEFLLTGFIQDDKSVVLCIPDKTCKNGVRLA